MLLLLFFVSGAIALVYQVVWQRQFALVFGSSSAATAAVLAAFFAGLGLGSLALGRWAARCSRPLRGYAGLELLVGLGAVSVSPILGAFDSLYPSLAHFFAGTPSMFVASKALLAFVALALPTFCMGGTLPILAQELDRGPRQLGVSVGRFYVANTLGAAAGALSVPLLLLPALGISRTIAACVAANGLIALAAWRLDRNAPSPASNPNPNDAVPTRRTQPAPVRASRPLPAAPPFRPGTITVLAVLSGVVTFSLQVLWNRAFAQVHENSLHSFAIIASAFIVALAIGGQIARTSLPRVRSPEFLLGIAWTAAGIALLAGPWTFVELTQGLSFLGADAGWNRHIGRLLFLASAVLLIPIALLGIGFPALLQAAGRGSESAAGPITGRLLAVNVVGCVAGALTAGFLLPHVCGLWTGITLAAGTLLAAGAWLLVRTLTPASSRHSIRIRAGGLAATAALVAAFAVNGSLPRVRIASRQGERLTAISEGTHGIVAVTDRPNSRRLKLNNHYALGGTLSLGDQRMQSHIPLLLHPNPRHVGHLGLGTGLSAGGLLFHPASTIRVVELVPEVVDAARTHFAEAAAGLFSDPRTEIIVDDARSFLRARPEPFDVLVGDLVVPWRQGEGSLFTLEHFQTARDSLAPGGVFCQWLPLFQLSEVETRILLRTFLSAFPTALVWRGDFSPDRPAIGLIGVREPFHLDPLEVRKRLSGMRPDPMNPQLADPAGLWMNFVGVLEAGDLDPGETRIHREDHPWIELLGPRTHFDGRRSTLVTSRALQRWLDPIRQRSAARMPQLTAAERNAAQAGDLLFEFSLALLERNEPEAGRLRQRLEGLLPAPVFRAVFGGVNP